MSTPSPASPIKLPADKLYQLTIDSKNFPPIPTTLTFEEDTGLTWIASFSVPSVFLTELNCPVTQFEKQYQFRFTVSNPSTQQKDAGYKAGDYIFTFAPPGTDPISFGGTVKDPWNSPDGTEDTWTARGGGGSDE